MINKNSKEQSQTNNSITKNMKLLRTVNNLKVGWKGKKSMEQIVGILTIHQQGVMISCTTVVVLGLAQICPVV